MEARPIIVQNADDTHLTNPLVTDNRILKQSQSQVLTNSFIPPEQQEKEIQEMTIVANKIVQDTYDNHNKSIKTQTLEEIITGVSDACIGISRDLFLKPDNTGWVEYGGVIIYKDNRYAYLGVLLIFIVLYIYIVS
jgi:hypothetical protein